jgi:sugar lactone lactonase YvrE
MKSLTKDTRWWAFPIRRLRSSIMRPQTRFFDVVPVDLLVLAIFQSALPSVSAGSADLDNAARNLPNPNTIYLTDYRSDTIETFSLTGSRLGIFGMPVKPTGLVFDNDGNLYVASDDPAGYSIQKFAPDGTVSVFADSGLSFPSAIVFDESGNLYVANPRNNTIEKFTPDGIGTEFANEEDGLNQPVGLAFDAAGNLYVSNANGGPAGAGSIERFTPDGVGSVFADSGLHVPFGLVFDSAGNLYVSNSFSDTIEKFSPTGEDLGVFASTGLNKPLGLMFDRDGNLYVANNASNTIEKFSPTGEDLGVFSHTGGGPHFFAMFRPGRLHFESEALTVQARSAGYRILSDPGASGGAYALLKATVPGDFVTYNVPIAAAGTYDVKVGIQTRNNRGIFQLAIAGVNQGPPQDEYSPTIGYEVRDLGTVTFTSGGNQTFRFLVTGRNPSSGGYALAFDYIDLDLIP